MNIEVTSRDRATKVLAKFSPTAIISISDINKPDVDFGLFEGKIPILKLKFDDVCFQPISDYDISRYYPPDDEIIDKILRFGKDHINDDSRLLVHCFAGISRSPAATIISMIPNFGINFAVEKVSKYNVYFDHNSFEQGYSWFMPNDLMISYADKKLELNGELVKLVYENFKY